MTIVITLNLNVARRKLEVEPWVTLLDLARSQLDLTVTSAVGSTLQKESYLDTKLGRLLNHNLAEYHIPVNADIDTIDRISLHEEHEKTSPIGAKGLGEIGIIGTGAAIANAICPTTGRRMRTLPITGKTVLGLV